MTIKTSDGKWVLWDLETGEQRAFWSIDARSLLDAGTHSTEPPEGAEVAMPPQPPKNVPAPKAAVAVTPEAPEPERELRHPEWPLQTPPADYLKKYPHGRSAALARQVLGLPGPAGEDAGGG